MSLLTCLLLLTNARKPIADKRSPLQMNVATAIVLLGQPGHASMATHEVETDTLSVTDFPHLNFTVLKSSQSTNFSVDISDAKSTADKRSHLQTNVATAIAPLGQPRHTTLAACEVETGTLSVTDFLLRHQQNTCPS